MFKTLNGLFIGIILKLGRQLPSNHLMRVSISTAIIMNTCVLNVRISTINRGARNMQKYKN
jgi:hypothetical protein